MNQEYFNLTNYALKFFLEYIITEDISSYYDICFSTDFIKDVKRYVNDVDKYIEANGTVIIPDKNDEKLHVVINLNSATSFMTVLHEIVHVCDFISFSKHYCDGKLNKIKQHKFYQIFVLWSEFHAQKLEIIYSQIFMDTINKEEIFSTFKNNIDTVYYQEYNNRILNNQNPSVLDFMYYFGELAACNSISESKHYYVPYEVCLKYGMDIVETSEWIQQFPEFADFQKHDEEWYLKFLG